MAKKNNIGANRLVVGAHYGVKDWLAQRITAILMVVYTLILLGLSWAYLHHFVAGVRHLFMDNHFALDKDAAQKTARWVLVISLVLTALVGLKLFGVF